MALSVPTTSGRTPKLDGAINGDHSVPVKNSPTLTSWKNSTVGSASATTIPIVVSTDTPAHASSTSLISVSPYRRREMVSRRAIGAPAPGTSAREAASN